MKQHAPNRSMSSQENRVTQAWPVSNGTQPIASFCMPPYFEMQSSLQHLAIIMDGNRRWAAQQGLAACEGHMAGAQTLKTIVEAINETSVSTLSVFGFSQLNWQRSNNEVQQLFKLILDNLVDVGDICLNHELRVEFIGRRDRLPHALVNSMEALELATDRFSRCLRIAIDYSSRDAMATAATCVSQADSSPNAFAEQLRFSQRSRAIGASNVDLLIRTGGERRLSDFLLWESAFAELHFEDCYWPDYTPEHLHTAIAEFGDRQRRFGR